MNGSLEAGQSDKVAGDYVRFCPSRPVCKCKTAVRMLCLTNWLMPGFARMPWLQEDAGHHRLAQTAVLPRRWSGIVVSTCCALQGYKVFGTLLFAASRACSCQGIEECCPFLAAEFNAPMYVVIHIVSLVSMQSW